MDRQQYEDIKQSLLAAFNHAAPDTYHSAMAADVARMERENERYETILTVILGAIESHIAGDAEAV